MTFRAVYDAFVQDVKQLVENVMQCQLVERVRWLLFLFQYMKNHMTLTKHLFARNPSLRATMLSKLDEFSNSEVDVKDRQKFVQYYNLFNTMSH